MYFIELISEQKTNDKPITFTSEHDFTPKILLKVLNKQNLIFKIDDIIFNTNFEYFCEKNSLKKSFEKKIVIKYSENKSLDFIPRIFTQNENYIFLIEEFKLKVYSTENFEFILSKDLDFICLELYCSDKYLIFVEVEGIRSLELKNIKKPIIFEKIFQSPVIVNSLQIISNNYENIKTLNLIEDIKLQTKVDLILIVSNENNEVFILDFVKQKKIIIENIESKEKVYLDSDNNLTFIKDTILHFKEHKIAFKDYIKDFIVSNDYIFVILKNKIQILTKKTEKIEDFIKLSKKISIDSVYFSKDFKYFVIISNFSVFIFKDSQKIYEENYSKYYNGKDIIVAKYFFLVPESIESNIKGLIIIEDKIFDISI